MRAAIAAIGIPLLLVTGCGPTMDRATPVSTPPTGDRAEASTETTIPTATTAPFVVTVPAVGPGGDLPVAFTCDGAGLAPPVRWSGTPPGTVALAVVMHHVAGPSDVHWYWIVYDIDPSVDHLDGGGVAPPGSVGTNSVDRKVGYRPPCSQGPGRKEYTVTVSALARRTGLTDPTRVDRPTLLGAIDGAVVAETTTTFSVTRGGSAR